MPTPHHHLRMHRKRSQLTQADIAFIMQLSDYSSISRWEKGIRGPSIDMLMVYHLLFDTPIESLFMDHKHQLAKTISQRIFSRIAELKTMNPDPKLSHRIAFLEGALTRLTA